MTKVFIHPNEGREVEIKKWDIINEPERVSIVHGGRNISIVLTGSSSYIVEEYKIDAEGGPNELVRQASFEFKN